MSSAAEVFRNAAQIRELPEPTIYRLRLSRLTLGHMFLLFRRESPVFGFSDREPDATDYLLAVFICAQPWRKSEKALKSWWINLFFRLWARLTVRLNAAEEARRFREWFQAERMPLPTRAPTIGSGGGWRTLATPMPYRMLALMMHMFHMREEEAMDLPFTHAECLFAAVAEWNGNLEFSTPRQDALFEFARQEDAKRFNPDGTRKQEAPPC